MPGILRPEMTKADETEIADETVVAKATRNVDADAGSIRYVATVIAAPGLATT